MKLQGLKPPRPLTLADLCEAIASGQLTAPIEDGYYTVSRRALRQLRPDADLSLMPRSAPLTRPDRIAS